MKCLKSFYFTQGELFRVLQMEHKSSRLVRPKKQNINGSQCLTFITNQLNQVLSKRSAITLTYHNLKLNINLIKWNLMEQIWMNFEPFLFLSDPIFSNCFRWNTTIQWSKNYNSTSWNLDKEMGHVLLIANDLNTLFLAANFTI